MTSEDTSISILDPFPGRVIAGNFRIERLIGSGAMGNVYQAEQLSLGKAVAVKILHAHLIEDDKLVRRFQREAKSASRLNHPNSIQIIDSGRDPDGVLYIAMELLAGRDLSRVIREEFPLPLPRIVRIMAQVLSALGEAHAEGVIHRDLKPSNIMLIERRGESDFVKVCDYGIAKAQMDDSPSEPQMLTIQGLVCGTPEYMSPEQARGEPLDGRADLYSAAVILFQMVTGDVPFHGNTPIAIVSRHLSESPALPSSRRPGQKIPADLDDLIMRGLAKNRELRPARAADFREELENIGTGRVGLRLRPSAATLPATRLGAGPWPDNAASTAGGWGLAATTEEVRRPAPIGKALLAVVLALAAAVTVGLVVRRGRGSSSRPVMAAATASAGAPVTAPAVSPGGAEVIAASSPPAIKASALPDPSAAAAALPADGQPASGDEKPELPGRAGLAHRNRAGIHRDRGTASAQSLERVARNPSSPRAADPGPATPPSLPTDHVPHGPAIPRAALADAEALLGQGEVSSACQHGEELRTANPGAAEVYRFLGKCYMRSGSSARAKENYRRYLELAPGAPDAMFIESIVK